MHDTSVDVQRITLNVSCMTISGGRTEQLDIFCRVTGFTSDFLSFVVVEHIRFFDGALQLINLLPYLVICVIFYVVYFYILYLCYVCNFNVELMLHCEKAGRGANES